MWEPREGCLRRGEGRVENHKRRGWVTQGVRDRRSKEKVASSNKAKRTREKGWEPEQKVLGNMTEVEREF